MFRFKKVLALVLTVVLTLSVLSACSSKKEKPTDSSAEPTKGIETIDPATETENKGFDVTKASVIKPTVVGKVQTGNKIPVEDKITPIWRDKTKVEPEIINLSGQDIAQYFSMQSIAGTLPEIIAPTNSVFDNADVYASLLNQKLLREITLDEIKTYMPRTVERLANWGISVEDWYNANVEIKTGKLWYIPGAPNLAATTLSDEEFVRRNNSYMPYSWYFRDDILKSIFPNAKTEQELRELYIKNGGNLSYEEVNDVPIYNLDDLYNYLAKVKELGVKVGNKDVIPAQMQLNSDPGSMMWSAFSLPGFYWQDLGDRLYNDDTLSYFAATPEWKEYIRWFNKAFNDKLLQTETFIQKDDQRDAKVVNGEYAVYQGWLPTNDARSIAKQEERGYGFRKVALFLGDDLTNNYQKYNEKNYRLRETWGAIGITTALKEEHVPQILNWVDWNYSEEANVLRAWGPSDFYQGEGKNRVFKEEYKDLENWAVYGTSSGKDGIYYGLYSLSGNDVDWNHETYGIGATWYYEYQPKNVYTIIAADADNVDIDRAYDNAIRDHYARMMTYYVEKPHDDALNALKAEFDDAEKRFAELKSTVSFDCDPAKTTTVKAIVESPEKFEENYAAYEKIALTPEFMDSVKDMGEKWIAYKKLLNSNYRVEVK